MKKVQLSPRRIIPDAITVWSEAGPEVDIVMDLANLTFRDESIGEMFVFHVLDHLFPEQSKAALKNWCNKMAKNTRIQLLNDNFDYISRAYIGNEISLDLFNDVHNHPCQLNQELLSDMISDAGFKADATIVWIEGAPEGMVKQHFEFILSAIKN